MNRKLQKECESGCEYVLPDYMGDIKKLLTSRAKAVPTGKFVGEGSVEVLGSVEYDLLYLDAEGKLTAVSASSDFTEKFTLDTETYIDSAEESIVSTLKIRVTGPRKISMKAEVETALTVSEENEMHIDGDVFSGNERTIEKCSSDVIFATSLFAKSGEREYAEIAERFEGVSSEEVEVIAVYGETAINDAVCSDGEVTVKGKNIVSAILTLPERPPLRIKTSIPFEEVIAVEGATPKMTAIADGFVSSANIGLGADGEYLNAVVNIIAEYNVELIENASVNVVTDAYTVDGECRNKYADAHFSECVFAGVKSFYVDVKCDKNEERISELCDVISVSAEVRPTSASLTKGGCEFTGEILVNGIGYENNVDGSINYMPFKIQDSFAEKVNLDCQIEDKNLIEYVLRVEDCEVSNDADDLGVRCLVTAKIYIFAPTTVRMLVSCESVEGEKNSPDASVVVVYYPKPGEKLFDVAKKYRTTSAKIAKDNALTESALASFDSPDSLAGVKKLIIR